MGIYQIHATSSMEGNRDTATKLKACVKLQKKYKYRFKGTYTNRLKKKAGKSREEGTYLSTKKPN